MLDLLLTNNSDIIHDLSINDTLLSITHHKIIEVSTTYRTKCKSPISERIPRLHSNEFEMLNFFSDQINWDNIRNKFQDYSWDILFKDKSAEEMLNIFYQVCLDVVKDDVPKRKSGCRKKNTFSRKKRKLLRRRKRINMMPTKPHLCFEN